MFTPFPSRLRQTAPRAFTLVELLVVITIVAALAGLSFPALARVKTQRNGVKCLANLRQIGQGMLLYAGEHNSEFPPVGEYPDYWHQALNRYMLATKGDSWGRLNGTPIWECPESGESVAYGYNSAVGDSNDGNRRLVAARQPANTVLVGDVFRGLRISLGSAAGDWNSIDERHGGRANFFFMDGHVGALKRSELTYANFDPAAESR